MKNSRRQRTAWRSGILGGLLVASAAQAHFHDPRALEADPATAEEQIAPVLEGIGDEHFEITTSVPAAQKFFDQGLRLTYGFNHSEALRAFKEAARLDQDCAMAYWGWALVLGPNINLPMQDDVREQAWEALQKALARKEGASAKEQALIDALATRHTDEEQVDDEGRANLDRAYVEAMRAVHEKYPEDNDVATLYGAALMNAMPWDYWYGDGSPKADTLKVFEALEGVMARDPEHTGALHYYIHISEEKAPEQAEVAADTLARLAPNAGHLVHMPAHIYMRLGRYQDSHEQNAKAVEADEGYFTTCSAQGIYPLAYYPHNIHFMVWSAMFEGRSEEALRLARKVAEDIPEHLDKTAWDPSQLFRSQPLAVMVRFGMWDEILQEPAPPEGALYLAGIRHYARSLAFLRSGKFGKAKKEVRKLRAVERDIVGVAPAKVGKLLEIARWIAESEAEARRGRFDEAIAGLEAALRVEGTLDYAEPSSWYFPVRHVLGAVLLEAGRADEAETEYWTDLRQFKENGFALRGLEKSLRAQGEDEEAEIVAARFKKAWERADIPLKSSRF